MIREGILSFTSEERQALILNALKIIFFTSLLSLSALIRIPLPFTPVPFTLQVFIVALSVLYLGRLSAVSTALYLLVGAIGIPVFSGGTGGLAHLAGPTGGYLYGFVVGAFIGGLISERGGIIYKTLSLIIALLIIYLCGCFHLILIYRAVLKTAITLGAVPFIVADLVKIAMSLGIYRTIGKIM
ncbi:MAG TPA: biotin transporter BioY [Firmicutes bacterium]|nr:biotin transporter BioY [Bacillota bacterium]